MLEDKKLPPADEGRLEPGVGRLEPERDTATPLMRSMLVRAGHIGASGQTLVTEWVGRRCVQCKGRLVQRCTLDGWQPVAAFSWLIDSKRASKADVWGLISLHATSRPTFELRGADRRPARTKRMVQKTRRT